MYELPERSLDPTPRLILESKRGNRRVVTSSESCAECRVTNFKSMMFYRHSNYGEVYICDVCLLTVQNRSWDYIDGFSSAVQGGAFNPR
jgi:hypothetical protein